LSREVQAGPEAVGRKRQVKSPFLVGSNPIPVPNHQLKLRTMNIADRKSIPQGVLVTATGKFLNILKPHPDQICIEDIAIGLSRENRFAGQTVDAYTVAQHSYLVSSLVPQEYALSALLHDASEAYLKDIPSPLKVMLRDYAIIEANLMAVIVSKFRINVGDGRVKNADKTALEFEWQNLVVERDPEFCWSQSVSLERFCKRYEQITGIKVNV
jgi:hypothetical protein